MQLYVSYVIAYKITLTTTLGIFIAWYGEGEMVGGEPENPRLVERLLNREAVCSKSDSSGRRGSGSSSSFLSLPAL